jgi:hypothetical protein
MIFLKDVDYISLSLCEFCKHRLTETTCVAFPQGIPDEVLSQDVTHTLPYPGDNGIRYEQADFEIEML